MSWQSRYKFVKAQLAQGNTSKLKSNKKSISFIANSGASEHITNTGFILQNMQK